MGETTSHGSWPAMRAIEGMQMAANETMSRSPVANQADQAWWALRDFPVRVAETIVPLVDGRAAMLAMCAAFLSAKQSIWLANWDMHAELRMVRAHDQRAGPDG